MVDNIFFDKKDLKYCGENVIIGKTVRIRHPEKVSIGDNVIIDDFTYISGNLVIGNYVHVAASCSIQASESKVIIGDFAGLASGVRVFAASADYINCSLDSASIPQEMMYGGIFEEVTINDFVYIGANSVILPGCKLPKGFAIGALCKLTKSLSLHLKPWHILVNDITGESVRRMRVKEMLVKAEKLTGINYEL